MKTQFASFVRWFASVLYGLLSDPQQVRLTLTIIIVCFVLLTLFVPALTALADGLSGGGSSSPH